MAKNNLAGKHHGKRNAKRKQQHGGGTQKRGDADEDGRILPTRLKACEHLGSALVNLASAKC